MDSVLVQRPLAGAKAARHTDLGNLVAQLPPAERAIAEYARSKAVPPNARLEAYALEKKAFEDALKKLSPEECNSLRHLLASTRFVDFAHIAVDVMAAFRGRGLISILDKSLHTLYDSQGGDEAAFANMDRANAFLKGTSLEAGVKRLLKVHEIAMQGEIDSFAQNEVGKIRSCSVIGDETQRGLTSTEIKRLARNPYLQFEPSYDKDSVQKSERIKGCIRYPDAVFLKPEAAQRLESLPAVLKKFQRFCQKSIDDRLQARSDRTPEYCKLTAEIIRTLLQERYAAFHEARKALGSLESTDAVLQYIKLVALHYRDIISIHPLGDGNGRSVRYESLYAPLDEVGISRPRLTDPDADILKSPSEWVRDVERGILCTDALYRDITERLTYGLRLEDSPELLFPNRSRDVGLELRFRGRKAHRNATLFRIDGAEFATYLDARFSGDAALYRRFKREPLESLATLRDEFKTLAKSTKAFCHVPGKGIELVEIVPVDHDCAHLFGQICSSNPERWKYKLNRFYRPNLIWRGLSSPDELSTESVLSTFTQLGWLTVCNNLAGRTSESHARLVNATQKEFLRYNSDLLSGRLVDVAKDHVGSGAGYDTSYGLSSSRKWAVAASFARGKGLLGYSHEEILAGQSSLGDRLIIGARQARKDLDVRRFKFINPAFSYRFGRQQEILAIGAIDPDAVMTVQRVDSKLRIQTSWVRSASAPSTIYEIDGGFHPEDGDPSALPCNRIKAEHRI